MSRFGLVVMVALALVVESAFCCGCNSPGYIGAGYGLGSGYGLGAGYGPGCGYGGEGQGTVQANGVLPVCGNTVVSGIVPVIGAVDFGGSVPACGAVTISGQCGCGCGCN